MGGAPVAKEPEFLRVVGHGCGAGGDGGVKSSWMACPAVRDSRRGVELRAYSGPCTTGEHEQYQDSSMSAQQWKAV